MLKAGFARVDITPPLGSYLSGYFRDRYADGVLDPIELNAIALENGQETVVIVTADILYINLPYSEEIRRLISERINVPKNNVVVVALHQHTSIGLTKHSPKNTIFEDHAYMDVLHRKFADVAQMAVNDLAEATLWVDEEPTAEPIAFIRRYLMKDGSILTNPGIARRDEIVHPQGEADNNVRLLRFKRTQGNDIAFVNFSTHPDVVSGTKFSADWPGFARRYVEADLKGVSCLLLVGAQGDSNHYNYFADQLGKGYAYSAHMGRVIADTVLKIWDRGRKMQVDRLCADFQIVYNRTRTDGAERYDECVALLEAHAKGLLPGQEKGNNVGGAQVSEARRIVNIKNETIYQKVPVTAVSVGNVALVGFGGEPFMHYAAAVREALPEHFIVASCCTNGSEGYWPTASAFAEGGYEANSTPFTSTLEEEVVGAVVEMLKKQRA